MYDLYFGQVKLGSGKNFMIDKNTPEALKPYEFHGLSLSINGTQAIADCPMCDGEKFFINKETGQYNCKNCGESGNKYTFMKTTHDEYQRNQVKSDYRKIRKLRNNIYPTEFIKKHNLCIDESGTILFPVKKRGKKNLVNLKRWNPSNRIFYNTPTCCSLYVERWSNDGPIFVCEGEWDALSLAYLIERANYDHPVSIVAVPGANTFKDSWINEFKGRVVYFLYDHDFDKERKGSKKTFNPGLDGMTNAAKKIQGTAKEIHLIDWKSIDDELKDGYDVTDYLKDAIEVKKPKRFLRRLIASCNPFNKSTNSKEEIIPLKRETFDSVVKDFCSRLEFNQTFQDALACCFASIVTLHMDHQKRNPLWLFLVAPPSSGKTTILEAFDACKAYTKQISEMTPAALVTGINMNTDEDPSLLAHLEKKVLFNEDFTPILNMGPGRDEIFGLLRAAYNGDYIARFATGERAYNDLYFGIVSGVTHAIERIDMGDLGERFLRIRLIDKDFNQMTHVMKALNNVDNTEKEEHKKFFQASVLGFTNFLMNNIYQPAFNPEIHDRLANISMLSALLRTEVQRKRGKELAYRPTPEVASRIATQLKKLGLGLALVYGKKEVDEDCYRVMEKLALDSCIGWKLELVEILSKAESGLNIQTVADRMQVHVNHIHNIADDCLQLGIITQSRVSNNSGRRGRKITKYKLSEEVQQLIRNSKLNFSKVEKHKATSNRTKKKRNG